MFENQEAITAAIEKAVAAQDMAGVSVCVRGPEGILYEHAFGVRNVERTLPVNRDTVFGIASMSKSVCALAACILHVEGKLNIDDPVTRYFPDFRVPGNPRDAVTLRHLCRHTAGIPPIEPLEWSIAMNSQRRDSEWLRQMRAESPNQMNTIEQVIDYVAHCPYPTLGAPGEYMSYCNEGYAVLSYVVDMAAGQKLEDFCMERIFRPLGMTRTMLDDGVAAARAMSGGNIISLFEHEDGQNIGDNDWSTMPPFRGCATVKSTAPDMAAYYQALSLNGMHDGVQAIPAAAVELLIGEEYPVTDQDVYCLGLNKYRKFGHVFCEHAGGLHGIATKGGLLKGEGIGFAVLSNQGDADMDDILWILYSEALGLPLDTCFRRFVPVGHDFSDPEMVVGSFTGHEGQAEHLKVYLEDGRLKGSKGDITVTLRYCGGTRFLGYTSETARSPVCRAEFLIRDGQAWGVRYGTRIFQRD